MKTWHNTARTISHLGRPDAPAAENPNHTYLGSDAPGTITERSQVKPGGLAGSRAAFDDRRPRLPVKREPATRTQAPGWRHHTARDSGPQRPTINERVAQSARFRSDRRHAIFRSQLDRFRTERGLSDELLNTQRSTLNPHPPLAERTNPGGHLPREQPRFKPQPPKPSDKPDGGVQDYHSLADDAKAWMTSARQISPTGRQVLVDNTNPTHSYLPEDAPFTIAERVASPSGGQGKAGLGACAPVFDSSVPRLFPSDATDQGAKFARGGAADPSNPGPGHYKVIDPVDWQRHDMVIPGKHGAHDKPRPTAVFEHRRFRTVKVTVAKPGPGWYEHHRMAGMQTGDAPSAPRWNPVVPEHQ